MFIRNSWYAAGWDKDLTDRDLVSRVIINQPVLLYRKADGDIVALEDRCCHRSAALHMGEKEGDCIRCMYHGLKFDSNGKCIEIPGQEKIPEQAKIRKYPVEVADGLIWVWMGEPETADTDLIPRGPGPDDKNFNIDTGFLRFNANYRLIADNLLDFSHLTYVHRKTFGGTNAYEKIKPEITKTERSIRLDRWVRNVPPMPFAEEALGGPGTKVDMLFSYEVYVPCVFIMQFDIHKPGTNTEGPSNGDIILATRTTQAIMPETEDSSLYWFSWGPSRETDGPGVLDLMMSAAYQAFEEDREMIQAQHKNIKSMPDAPMIPIVHDSALAYMRWLTDKILKEESNGQMKTQSLKSA